MYIDKHGLPVQRDNDANDQLNRVGILALSDYRWFEKLQQLCSQPGVYTRFTGSPPDDVSGDQLVPVFAATLLQDRKLRNGLMADLVFELISRNGFAQNSRDQDGSKKILPDFLLHRVLPFITRAYFPRFVTEIGDLLLFMNTLFSVIDIRMRSNPDHVDPYVNAVATLYACNVHTPTRLSKLSVRLLERGSIVSKGGELLAFPTSESNFCSKVAGGLRWYHRTESGGNWEVGELQIDNWVECLEIAGIK